MVVRGKIRSNGTQLATYLLTKADNDNVRLFDIKGTSQQGDLHFALLEMSLTSELTNTDKGLYHVQICPAYGEDQSMKDVDWIRAADIMEAETGFGGQKRVIVLHEKNGKTHAHVVWERYSHDTGIMLSNKFSRLAQDRARIQMEKEFEHKRTPIRNPHRPEMKAFLSKSWQQSENGGDFVRSIADKGYVIAEGTKRPYMVVDPNGRSFDLVRQLAGVKTKEVRNRLCHLNLAKEKQAISAARKAQFKEAKMLIVGETKAANDNSKEVLKQQAIEKMRLARMKKAKDFRDNDLDMTL